MFLKQYRNQFLARSFTGYRLIDQGGKITPLNKMNDIRIDNYRRSKEPFINWDMFYYIPFDPKTGITAEPYYPIGTNESTITMPFILLLTSVEDADFPEQIELLYPDIFNKEKAWGFGNDLLSCINGDIVVYSFAASSNVYIYNRKTLEHNMYEIPSKYMDNLFSPHADNPNEKSTRNGRYYDLRYDPHRNVYWRLQVGPAKGDYSKRTMSITQISSDFKKFSELKLPEDMDIFPWLLIGKHGIWMSYVNAQEEEEMHLLEIPLELFD